MRRGPARRSICRVWMHPVVCVPVAVAVMRQTMGMGMGMLVGMLVRVRVRVRVRMRVGVLVLVGMRMLRLRLMLMLMLMWRLMLMLVRMRMRMLVRMCVVWVLVWVLMRMCVDLGVWVVMSVRCGRGRVDRARRVFHFQLGAGRRRRRRRWGGRRRWCRRRRSCSPGRGAKLVAPVGGCGRGRDGCSRLRARGGIALPGCLATTAAAGGRPRHRRLAGVATIVRSSSARRGRRRVARLSTITTSSSSGSRRHGIRLESAVAAGRNLAILATALDALVRVLVQRAKVLPQLPVGLADGVALADVGKLLRQPLERLRVELILMGLLWFCRVSGSQTPIDQHSCERAKEDPTLRFPSCVNCFRQSSSLHTYGFWFSCTILWARTLPRCANRLPQISQQYGRSPVCRRSWVYVAASAPERCHLPLGQASP